MAKKFLCVLLIYFISTNLCFCTYETPEEPTLPVLVPDPTSAPLVAAPGKTLHEINPAPPSTSPTEASTTAPTKTTEPEPSTEMPSTTVPSMPETVPPATEPPVTEPPVTMPPETEPPTTVPPETVHEHRYELTTVLATCTGGGYERYTCGCGEYYTSNHSDPLGHTWAEWTTTVAATTSREGKQVRSCTRCGYEETQEIPRKDIPEGNTIYLNNALSQYPEKGLSCMMEYPTEADFGAHLPQAVALYEAILAGEENITLDFLTEEHKKMEDSARCEALQKILDDFHDEFNESVLCGLYPLRPVRSSSFAGYSTIEAGRIARKLTEQAAENYAYYNALVQAGIYDRMSEKQAVTALNNWICSYLHYSGNYCSPLEALEKGGTNCTGYALLFYALCDQIGIECELARGEVNDGSGFAGHAWNRVRIGGNWYLIDVCWNDTPRGNIYFLSEEGWENHHLDYCESALYY